jgi:hypothetical protein
VQQRDRGFRGVSAPQIVRHRPVRRIHRPGVAVLSALAAVCSRRRGSHLLALPMCRRIAAAATAAALQLKGRPEGCRRHLLAA